MGRGARGNREVPPCKPSRLRRGGAGEKSVTNGAPAVELRNATKKYGEFVALSGVDLAVAEGTVHAVIGTNGAGKSTLLGVLAGTVSPTAGRILLRGRDVTRAPGWRRARL